MTLLEAFLGDLIWVAAWLWLVNNPTDDRWTETAGLLGRMRLGT